MCGQSTVTTKPVWALGLMSGTSLDGIDAALLRTDGERIYELGPWRTVSYRTGLREKLRRLAHGSRDGLDAVEAEMTEMHAEVALALIAEAGQESSDISVAGFHGHTIWHDPTKGRTCQIGDGALLARRLAIDVVNDFRSADVAAGGQGAPLVPLYHLALARSAGEALAPPIAFLNLGGVANITWIGAEGAILAFDTGPGCAMIDDWLRARTGAAYDAGGVLASGGRVDRAVLAELLRQPYFSAPPPKSLDRNDFNSEPLAALSDADGAATLVAFTAATVAAGLKLCRAPARRLLVTGGGRHNPAIMAALAKYASVDVAPVEAMGWRGDALEAEAFAYLAVRSLNGSPLSLPETTGVDRPLSGGVLHRKN
jgi:anhydro-N-acetylmuramic acid kinase